MTQQIIDQLAARRAIREAEYQRHGNMLDNAKLLDTSAIAKAKTAPLPPIVRVAANVVTATSMADFIDKYARVGAGGTVDLGNTVLDYGSNQFVLRPNVTIANGELRFTRPKGGSNSPDKNCFGMIAPSGTPGIGFSKTKIRSNNGGVWFESGIQNAHFDGVDVVHGTNGSYYSRLFIWAGGGAPGLTIVNGFFHDSQSSDRTLEVWGWSNGDYNFNRFDNVKDGGHIMENGGRIRMVSNLFTKLGRMGVEVQGNAASDDFLFENNVAYSWVNPYFDCELISHCAVNMTGVKIRKNYARNDFTGNWGNTEDQGQRFGIAIEAMTADNGCIVEDNDIGGPNHWACIVAAGSKNMLVRNMRVYGAACLWGDYVGEPGTRGQGTIQDGGGNQRLTSPMPDPPNPIDGGGNGGGPPTMNLAIKNPTLQANGGASVPLSVTALPVGTRKVVFHSRASGDTTLIDKPQVAPTPVETLSSTDLTTVDRTITDVHPGWHVDFLAEAFGAAGTSLGSSGWITSQQLPGNPSTSPWPPTVTPPPPGGFIVTQESEIDGSGKVLSSKATTKPRTVAP